MTFNSDTPTSGLPPGSLNKVKHLNNFITHTHIHMKCKYIRHRNIYIYIYYFKCKMIYMCGGSKRQKREKETFS